MPTLYIVATPIGNLEDITLRALRILKEVDLIAAEDTRETRKLLTHYGIKTPLTSYNERNKLHKLSHMIEQLSQKDIALVSDAGTPGISDPGREFISEAITRGFSVTAVPGPCAIITALTLSGLHARRFLYLGFLPRKATERRRILAEVSVEKGSLVVLEAPHRLQDTLQDALHVLGDRPVAICRELTKLYEEVFRGTLKEALEYFTDPRGEFTLVIAGHGQGKSGDEKDIVLQKLSHLYHEGMTAREAIDDLSLETGIPRNTLYQLWLRLTDNKSNVK